MKKIAIFFLVTFSFTNIFAGGIIKNGTPVILTLSNDVNSESGESPIFIVANDVKDTDGSTLISKGTNVISEFNSKKRKGVGKPGEIEIKFVSTNSTDGQTILLNGTKKVEGEDNKGKALGVGLGVGLLLIFPMLAFMAKKGGSAEIKAGTNFSSVTVMGEYQIK